MHWVWENIRHLIKIDINCWFPVYRLSVMLLQVLISRGWGFMLPVLTKLTTCKLGTENRQLMYTDPKWKLYTLFHWITVLLVYMSLYDLRMLIETSSQITIMQFSLKSKVYLSVNAWKTCSLRCTCWGTGGSLTVLKPTRKYLQLSTGNKK